ncbi:MAG: class I SAM-dependent methyltransferase [Bacteroidota bacterium]
MSDLIHYTHCPVCGHAELTEVFPVIDQLVSRELFTLVACGHCLCRLTQGAPDQASSYKYYQSTDYISHSNTNRGWINRLYQQVRKRTLLQKVRLVSASTGLSNGRVLDVGSGTGAFVSALRKAGWQADGLEPDPTARKVALSDFGTNLLDIDRLFHLPEASFDAITLWHVLEHVHDLNGYMKQFHRLLKPGGTLLIALPNYTSWDATHFGNWWAAYDVPRHLYHFCPRSIRSLAQAHRFSVDSIRPMWYDAFYIALLSHQHQYGNSRWLRSGWVGSIANLNALFNKERGSSLIYELRSV